MSDETLFAAALEKADPAERAAFLDEACPDPTARASGSTGSWPRTTGPGRS